MNIVLYINGGERSWPFDIPPLVGDIFRLDDATYKIQTREWVIGTNQLVIYAERL